MKMEELIVRHGLKNVGYSPTELCRLDEENRKIFYRGYDLAELAEHSTFEECAYLLLYGELPTEQQFQKFCNEIVDFRSAIIREFAPWGKGDARKLLALMNPKAHPMDMLRALISVFGCNALTDKAKESKLLHAIALMSAMPVFVAAIGHYQKNGKFMKISHFDTMAEREVAENQSASAAKTFLRLLRNREPKEEEWRALDVSLMLYLEHEFNVGTHVVHAITSANADIYSANIGGACALKGDAHGGANEAALAMLEEIGAKEQAEEFIKNIFGKSGETVKGFGHAIYKHGDPRCVVMKPIVKKLARGKKEKELYDLAEHVEELMLKIKGLHPNIDYWTAPLYSFLKIPKSLATPIFEMSRTVGWSAHHLEYLKLNRTEKGRLILIRPRSSKYIGPAPRLYVPVNK